MGLHKSLEEFLNRPEFNTVKVDEIITLRIYEIIEKMKLEKEFYGFPASKDTLNKNLPQVIKKKYKMMKGELSTDLSLIRKHTTLISSFHFLES